MDTSELQSLTVKELQNFASNLGATEFSGLRKQDLIKTESYEENIQLYFEEGLHWLKRKYGFTSRWSMQQYVKLFYDQFFEFHPEYKKYKI